MAMAAPLLAGWRPISSDENPKVSRPREDATKRRCLSSSEPVNRWSFLSDE